MAWTSRSADNTSSSPGLKPPENLPAERSSDRPHSWEQPGNSERSYSSVTRARNTGSCSHNLATCRRASSNRSALERPPATRSRPSRCIRNLAPELHKPARHKPVPARNTKWSVARRRPERSSLSSRRRKRPSHNRTLKRLERRTWHSHTQEPAPQERKRRYRPAHKQQYKPDGKSYKARRPVAAHTSSPACSWSWGSRYKDRRLSLDDRTSPAARCRPCDSRFGERS